MFPALVVLGLVFKGICLVMFQRIGRMTSTNITLFSLTVADILILFNGAINSILQAAVIYNSPITRQERLLFVRYFDAYVNALPSATGNTLTMFISLERLLCVLKPLKVHLISTSKEFVYVSLSFILPVVTRIPNLFLYTTEEVYNNNTGSHTIYIQPTTYGRNKELTNIVYMLLEIA